MSNGGMKECLSLGSGRGDCLKLIEELNTRKLIALE